MTSITSAGIAAAPSDDRTHPAQASRGGAVRRWSDSRPIPPRHQGLDRAAAGLCADDQQLARDIQDFVKVQLARPTISAPRHIQFARVPTACRDDRTAGSAARVVVCGRCGMGGSLEEVRSNKPSPCGAYSPFDRKQQSRPSETEGRVGVPHKASVVATPPPRRRGPPPHKGRDKKNARALNRPSTVNPNCVSLQRSSIASCGAHFPQLLAVSSTLLELGEIADHRCGPPRPDFVVGSAGPASVLVSRTRRPASAMFVGHDVNASLSTRPGQLPFHVMLSRLGRRSIPRP